jgi:PAS domain S-box-containing protein
MLLVIAAAACAAFAILAWKRPTLPGARAFVWLGMGMAGWSLAYAMELGSRLLVTKVFWAKLQFLFIAAVPLSWLIFVLAYTGQSARLSARNKALLLVLPAATLLLVATDHLHGLVISRVALERHGSYTLLVRSFGPWFWLHAAYCYLLIFFGSILMIQSIIRSPHRYRAQSIALLAAALVPLGSNAIYLLGLSPFASLDITPFAFSLSAIALAWGTFRGRLLDITPVAYDQAIKSMHDSVLILDDHNRVLDANQAARAMLGEKPLRIVGEPVETLLAPWPKLLQHLHSPSGGREEIVIRSEGHPRYYDLLISPITSGSLLVGRLVVFRDITRRKHYEKALRESEERFRSAFDQALIGMLLIDLEGDFLAVNSYVAEMLGHSVDELLEMNLKDITHAEHANIEAKRRIELIDGDIKQVLLENRYLRKDGGVVWGRYSASLLRDTLGDPMYIVAHLQNLTEQKQIETEKRRLEIQTQVAQRMESIGTLAGGIAHDFNNILMSIQGNVSLLRSAIKEDLFVSEKLQTIEHYIQSGAKLTQQLLGFARSGKYEVKPLDFNRVIEKTANMFGRTRMGIDIKMTLDQQLWRVSADHSQVEQILLNLYVNAGQAMPRGGKLSLDTSNVFLDGASARPYRVEPGKYVKVSVTDTGEGIDAAIQQRIFEPFFTTKEMGRGTGLGLASVYGIVKNHGGYINVYSEKGLGTTFNLYFPALDRSAAGEVIVPQAIERGTETILFVDDEAMILATGEELLKELGYTVLIANGGKEAIELVAQNREYIDLVILDLVMPGLSGKETFLRLKATHPQIKVLLSSGYSINGSVDEILREGCDGFIQKPFNVVQLSTKIRRILDAGSKFN